MIKTRIYRIVLLILVVTLLACKNDKKKSNTNMDKIILKINASFSGMIGYGSVFRCDVVEVIEGGLDDKQITLTILAEHKENMILISSHLSPNNLIIEFKKRKEGELNSLMPISGFVDKSKTSWDIIKIKVEE